MMTNQELMISDWVCAKTIKDKNAKITELYKTLDFPSRQMVSLNAEGLRYCVPTTEVEPIPLTGAILLANNFSKEVVSTISEEYKTKSASMEIMVRLTNGCAYVEIEILNCAKVSMVIEFVHELQRLIRACGRYNFANEFVV